MSIYNFIISLFNDINKVIKPHKVIMFICPQCGFKVFYPKLFKGSFKVSKCECCNYETITEGQLVDANYKIDNSKAIERGHQLTVDQLNELITRGMPKDVATKCLDLYNRFSINKQDDFDEIDTLFKIYKISRTQM